jgi:hypothetical protein
MIRRLSLVGAPGNRIPCSCVLLWSGGIIIVMKPMLYPLCALLSCALALPCHARLGETAEECEARYGAPTMTKDAPKTIDAPGATTSAYEKAGLRIIATIYQGKVGSIFFEKIKENALGKSVEFSNAEVSALLEANGGGNEWTPVSPLQAGFGNKGWLLEDGSAMALLVGFENRLIFTSMELSRIQEENKRKRQQENLEDF